MTTIDRIINEVERATRKFPTWPTDPLHALAVLGEEFGELTKAVLQQTYEPHKNLPGEVMKEAIQTAAMALRFAMSLDAYEHEKCPQHEQSILEGGCRPISEMAVEKAFGQNNQALPEGGAQPH